MIETLSNIGLVVIALGLVVTIFAFGWNSAVRSYKKKQDRLALAIEFLEDQMADINKKFENDPMRAAIDIGKTHVINTIENTLRVMKETIS